MNKRLILIAVIMILVGGCVHQGSQKLGKNEGEEFSAKLNEAYPIVGISVSNFEALFKDIKEQIPPDEQIISIGVIVHSSTIQVMTGRIDGPLAESGSKYIFENKENKWVLVGKSIWAS